MVIKDYFEVSSEDEKSKYIGGQCKFCPCYPCELINEYLMSEKNIFSTIEQECPVKLYIRVECNTKYVADGIGNHYAINTRYNFKIEKDTIDQWESKQPVFISAQTGSGKNYFIENTLLSFVRELNHTKRTNQKVLILSNRIALRQQTLDRIKCKVSDSDSEEGKIYPYGNYADVISYQSVLGKADYLKRIQDDKDARNRRYLFIICDEAHFFTADAMFNPDTAKILSAITDIFHNAIRVYMTATPYECSKYINEYENKYFFQNSIQRPCSGVFYHFKRNYDYLDIKYYSREAELMELVANSKDKWLMFIDDKERCRALKNKLENHIKTTAEADDMNDKVFAVDAQSKYNPKYQQMILDEKFPDETKVLIATSVIDNGVNFKDPLLKHVVISDISKTKCLQMVGRVRVEKGDKITLYIKRHDEQSIERKIKTLEKQQDAYHDYDLAYNRPDYINLRGDNFEYEFFDKYYNDTSKTHENATHWFGKDKKALYKFYLNEIARSLGNKLVLEYKSILDEMQSTDDRGQGVTGQKYLERQLSWLGKTYAEENDITLANKGRGKNLLLDLLESYAASGKQMFENDQKKFSGEFTKLYDSAFQREDKNKDRHYGKSKINSLLKEQSMDYMVESKNDSDIKKTY